MSMLTLPVKDPEERVFLRFNFAKEIPAADAVVGATITAALTAGVDPTPAAVLDGAPILGTRDAGQWVRGGVDGASYQIKCVATTQLGRVLVLRGLLPVSVEP